jgi:hypothetical protein
MISAGLPTIMGRLAFLGSVISPRSPAMLRCGKMGIKLAHALQDSGTSRMTSCATIIAEDRN